MSLEKNFLFVHIPKAAGTSLRDLLKPYCQSPQQFPLNRLLNAMGVHVNRWGPFPGNWFRLHDTARTARRWLPAKAYANLYKFAFVRNPWDRMVSFYSYICKRTDHHRHQSVIRLGSFEAFLEMELKRQPPRQVDYVTDHHGQLIVDFVGRFEQLPGDVAKICQLLGITASLGHRNESSHARYVDLYNDRTRRLVADYFAADIERFAYEFGTSTIGPRRRSQPDADNQWQVATPN